jgi:hypothetical protein
MMDRIISALMAACLAFLVWLYARGREQETLDNVPIAVQLALAPGQAERYDLEINGPSQVLVSFTGPLSCIRELRGQLQRGEIHVELTLNVPEDRLNDSRFLDTVRVQPEDVHVPPGVTPVVVEGRNRIPITIQRLIERRLSVHVEDAPEEGVVRVEPSTVLVRGPQEILERARSITTQPCVLAVPDTAGPEKEAVSSRKVALLHELDGRPIHCTPETVTVQLTVAPRQRLYELDDVPVRFLCPVGFALRPQFVDERSRKISLRVRGPAGEGRPHVVAFVDLCDETYEPRLYECEPMRLQLPKDFQLAQAPPRCGPFRLTPLAGSK